ncbi:MAG: mandelate racemase/muconate lactonizing enzyme family protein [Dehalococcoidia bacterium]|jgi:L-alanine-DL-glutamate epimerase-like enolase superfamily enzyme
MKITGFQTGVVSLPREAGPMTGGLGDGKSASAEFVTIKIQSAGGAEGIGYSGFTSSVMLKPLKVTIDSLLELIIEEDSERIDFITNKFYSIAGSGAPAGILTRAISGIEVALWDLKGKLLNQPIYKLLGGSQNKVRTYASGYLWRNFDLDRLQKKASELIDEGYDAMKFRLGGESSNSKEIERMKVMREAVGPDVTLMVDVNQAWDVNTSITIGRKLEEYDLYWLEDPVYHQDYAGLSRIAEALDLPVANGEYHYGIEPFKTLIDHNSVDIILIDLLRAGGISQWMKIAHIAEINNLKIASHLATETLLHCVAASPNGLWVEHMPWTFPMFEQEPTVKDGYMILPDDPGIGVNFDESALKKYKHTG